MFSVQLTDSKNPSRSPVGVTDRKRVWVIGVGRWRVVLVRVACENEEERGVVGGGVYYVMFLLVVV